MRIGPIGSNPFIDLKRTNDLIKKPDIAKFLRKKDVNYLERTGENRYIALKYVKIQIPRIKDPGDFLV